MTIIATFCRVVSRKMTLREDDLKRLISSNLFLSKKPSPKCGFGVDRNFPSLTSQGLPVQFTVLSLLFQKLLSI